ncbi:UNVERIFIED_CONTAM: UDP-glucosyltransferase 29 [Sesamum calycinum]|uniref:UDP-glucosyltransferase 29 n=1 Tax=Sesamum calycinum TaxID=2727403 RepID=A0AAW2QK51_9LAMI
MPTLMHAFQLSASTFSDIITRLKPDLLIYDGFQPWSAKLASSQGIPAVYFALMGSIAFSFFHHLFTHKSSDSFPYPAICLHEYEKRDLIAEEASIKVQDVDEGFAFGVFELSCDIVLIKSCCMGVERKYIDYLSTLCKRRIVPVGPLVQENAVDHETDSWIMHWLSKKSKSSTLYISFGSENYFSEDQIQEIAKGLELSKVNFIWVVRSPVGSDHVDVEEALPEGFVDRVRERGVLVQEWAPQAAILASPAVAGFMSHCGWSSITESVYFGVPVVAVPLKLDQPVNSRLVVEAGFGVEVGRDEEGKFAGEGVGRAIDEVMLGESGERLRKRVRELSEKIKVEEEVRFCVVVEELSRICMKKSTCS